MNREQLVWPGFVLATVLFYAAALFSPGMSIHWDLAGVSYPVQRYLSETLKAGHLPYWTPYLFSGTPLLGNAETGAWYPLHWPFLIAGIQPRALVWELALHCFLALSGTFLLARRIWNDFPAAVIAALLYAWGGFFAAHSSQLSLFESAALFPWLLLAALAALETGSRRQFAATALAGGMIALAGNLPAAWATLIALVLVCVGSRKGVVRTILVIAAGAVGIFVVGAVQILPALDVYQQAAPAEAKQAFLAPASLLTLVSADHYGMMTGFYKGPLDIRDNYLYAGLLLVPLAIAGFVRKENLLLLGAMVLPGVWLAAGNRGGLYWLCARLPAFSSLVPSQFWFLSGLGLAIAAGAGGSFVVSRLGRPRMWIILIALTVADLWFWNMSRESLALRPCWF